MNLINAINIRQVSRIDFHIMEEKMSFSAQIIAETELRKLDVYDKKIAEKVKMAI